HRSHEVLHLVSDLDLRGGRFEPLPEDPAGLRLEMVSIAKPLRKYDFARRALQEREYGRVLRRRVATFSPDVALNANTAPLPSLQLVRGARAAGYRYVHWMQDIYSL